MRADVIAAARDAVIDVVLHALNQGEPPTSDALRLLLRVYVTTGREDLPAAIEPALGNALEIAAASSSASASGWLLLFAEAADASDDARLPEVASDLASKVRMNWGGDRPIAVSAASVDAYLRALSLLGAASAQPAIDELERLVTRSYEPGRGIGESVEQEMTIASALLTAFAVTERVPYAMLAEELLRHSRAALSDPKTLPFVSACAAAEVLSRMAALHQLSGYRSVAVIAPDADYSADAGRLLEEIAADAPTYGIAAAAYGLAAGELQSALR